MTIVVVAILLSSWIYTKPLIPVTYFGRLWGKRVPWTAGMIGAPNRYPSLWRGVQVRESAAWCNVIDLVLRRPPEYQTIGCTLGRTIIVRPGYLAPWLIVHELEHVNQWEERGWYAVTDDAELEAEQAEAEFQKR